MATKINLRSTTVGAKLSVISAIVALVACVFYCVNAPAANVFDAKIVIFLVVGALSALAYVALPQRWADVLNLVAVVLLAIALIQVAVNSIATFADVLNGITMFGSTGGIEWIVAELVMVGIAMVVEQVSCFMRRTRA